MQRSGSVVVGLVFAAALIAAVYLAGHRRGQGAAVPGVATSASAEVVPAAAPSGSAEEEADLLPPEPDQPTEWAADAGTRPLPPSAPSAASFGVVLFTYQGVQLAPKNARSKQEALALAQGTIEEAKKDFAAAVKKGDHGSTVDAGRIPRGVLEPDLEYALFTLDKGAVSPEPIDTPRGYWVLRRNE